MLCCWLPVAAVAHPGGLDSSGGHNDRRNGGYHSHRAAAAIAEPVSPLRSPGATRATPAPRTTARTTARTSARTSAVEEDRRALLAEPDFVNSRPATSAAKTTQQVATTEEEWLATWDREARIFTSIAGTTLLARLKSVAGSGDDRVITLERRDHSLCRTPVVKLVHEDIAYVDTWTYRKR